MDKGVGMQAFYLNSFFLFLSLSLFLSLRHK